MKKLLLNTLIGLALLTCQTSFAQKTKAKFSPIKVETPARPANQQDVIQLVTPKLETVRVGFIGLGMRGLVRLNAGHIFRNSDCSFMRSSPRTC